MFSEHPQAALSALGRRNPRKILRVLVITFLTTFALTLSFQSRHVSRHRGLERPADPAGDWPIVVHGKVVKDATPAQQYPLVPFPESPVVATESDPEGRPPRPWLAAVISSAPDAERRMIIRSTWMRLFRDVPYDGRFVVANPGPQWTEVVAQENRTFGDMIVLENIQEDDVTANTIKTLEFFKWLAAHSRRYEFVTKMDTDLWLNARGFWDRFLVPRLSNGTGTSVATVDRTVIAELYYSKRTDLAFPHGAMYTVTWDIVELLARLQERYDVATGEDMAVSILMLKARERANFVNLKGTEKFDYDDRDARNSSTAWARQGTHPEARRHAFSGAEAVAVHQLKSTRTWYKVAACFDEDGIKPMPPPSGPDREVPFALKWLDFWTWLGVSSSYRPFFERIPDRFFKIEGNNWICDGIWNLGNTKEGWGGHPTTSVTTLGDAALARDYR